MGHPSGIEAGKRTPITENPKKMGLHHESTRSFQNTRNDLRKKPVGEIGHIQGCYRTTADASSASYAVVTENLGRLGALIVRAKVDCIKRTNINASATPPAPLRVHPGTEFVIFEKRICRRPGYLSRQGRTCFERVQP